MNELRVNLECRNKGRVSEVKPCYPRMGKGVFQEMNPVTPEPEPSCNFFHFRRDLHSVILCGNNANLVLQKNRDFFTTLLLKVGFGSTN